MKCAGLVCGALLAAGCSTEKMSVASAPATGAEYDIVIVGGTSAGISAALQAKRMGRSAVVIEETERIGGLTTGGLGQTDIGQKRAFGGIAREFYRAVKAHYLQPESWKWQKPDEYRPNGQSSYKRNEDAMWTFEPSAALKILERWERENGLRIVRNDRLDRSGEGVTKKNGRITAVRTESGKIYRGKMFIDATYEGDLMAAAGVSYAVGREANSEYDETISGIQRAKSLNHQMRSKISAYRIPGDPSSGVLNGVENPDTALPDGSGDKRVQAYCFRMCLTDKEENRIPFKKPEGYREEDFELLFRNLERAEEELGPKRVIYAMPWINSPMPNRKTDTNNRTGFSTDYIGANYDWPEASYARRDEIRKAHLIYQQGLMWSLAYHPRVPKAIRDEVSKWGMCKDEFENGGGWQHQLYVREARRLKGEYVMTEHNCRRKIKAAHSVGMGAYGMDSHNCRRYVDKNGFVRNEGNIEDYRGMNKPYPIDFGAIVPKRAECKNLLVPICVSSSHMAFGSIRMEPVFFALGQSAATAAVQAIESDCAIQDIDYAKLRKRLLADGQVLEID